MKVINLFIQNNSKFQGFQTAFSVISQTKLTNQKPASLTSLQIYLVPWLINLVADGSDTRTPLIPD